MKATTIFGPFNFQADLKSGWDSDLGNGFLASARTSRIIGLYGHVSSLQPPTGAVALMKFQQNIPLQSHVV
jgi:hypothetical protein